MSAKVRGVRARNEPAARPWCAAVGVTGRPHARGIPRRFRHANVHPPWPRRARTGGWVKVQSLTCCGTTLPIIDGFFIGEVVCERLGSDGGHRQAERGQRSCWGIRPPKGRAASRPRPCQPDPGAIAGRVCDHAPGPDFRRINFPFNGLHSGSYVYKGTMGTWEQALSDRQKALRLRGASLFPSLRADLGTWEQKRPIPMQEIPRACGSPVPPPAGERG